MAHLIDSYVDGNLVVNGTAGIEGGTTNILKYVGLGSPKFYALLDMTSQTGNFYATSFYASSDRRLKENIVKTDIDYKTVLDALNIVDFNFIHDEDKTLQIGVIAQELREALPAKYQEAFISGKETEGSHLSVNESKLVYIALLALKDQEKRIADLEEQIKKLKGE